MFLMLFVSCKKEDYISFQELSVAMHYDEQKQLTLSFSSNELSALDYTYQSSDENIASVSDSGLVSGVSIGTVIITATSPDGQYKAACTVVVEPKSKIYREPFMGWGATKATVKKNETRRIKSESPIDVLYYGEYNYIAYVFYNFDNSDTLLQYSGIKIGKPEIVINNIFEFLNERYISLDTIYDYEYDCYKYKYKHRTKEIYCYLYDYDHEDEYYIYYLNSSMIKSTEDLQLKELLEGKRLKRN